MFKIGDVVVYSTSGVCEVEEITTKAFGDAEFEYYVLKPLMQKAATVFVPTKNEALSKKIHPVLTKDEFNALFETVKATQPKRPETEADRKQRFSEILEKGDRLALFMMVYDLNLYAKQQQENGRRLHLADERLLSAAEQVLFEEIAYAFDITLLEAEELADSLKK